MQIIIYHPLMKGINYPQNVETVNLQMTELATYDLLPTDDLFPIIFGFKDLKPINDRFEYMDFISTNFLMNMGSLFIVWCFMMIQAVIYVVGTYSPCLKNRPCCIKVTTFFTSGLFWSTLIEFLA
jgi:hypothetical protein